MLEVVAFAIWYGDGSIRRGTTRQEWNALPTTDVQVIIAYHAKPYRTIISGIDIYNLPGYPRSSEKSGSWTTDEAYATYYAQALNEPY